MARSSEPLAYFITFSCYGQRLHGDPRGSIDRDHNAPGAEPVAPDRLRQALERSELSHPSVRLDSGRRTVVRQTIRDVADHSGWRVWAMNVRTTHVHVVISAPDRPELVMTRFKGWCTRRLRKAGLLAKDGRAWSRHGSTRYLWDDPEVETACRYVLEGQERTLS